MNCQRCSPTRGGPAVARIRGEILDLKVCASCVREAVELGLNVEPLENPPQQPEAGRLPNAA
jgi:hypothetical protein